MKLLLALFLALSSQGWAAYAANTLGYYQFEGTLADATGQQSAATGTGSLSYVASGGIGGGTAIAPSSAGNGATVDFPTGCISKTAGAIEWFAKADSDVTTTQCMVWTSNSTGPFGIANEFVIVGGVLRADYNNADTCGGVTPTVSTATQYYFAITWDASGCQFYKGNSDSSGNVTSIVLVCSSGSTPDFAGTPVTRLFNGFNSLDKWNNTSGIDNVRFSSVHKTLAELPTVDPVPVPTPTNNLLSPYMRNSTNTKMAPPCCGF